MYAFLHKKKSTFYRTLVSVQNM